MDTINGELIAKDLQVIEKRLPELDNLIARKNLKPDKDEKELLVKVKEVLDNKKFVRDAPWTAKEIDGLNTFNFLTAKPTVYLVNIGYEDFKKKKNKWLPKIQEFIKENGGGPMIPFSADYEKDVISAGTDPEERRKKAEELGAPSCINKIIKTGYTTL